ncbi:MAG TPA: hypothetical protein ENI61_05775 [Ignavibacteria bacterium]|nr:hypothetical protein [Ignavibacteria bacterium]
MGPEKQVILYEGKNSEEFSKVKDFLKEKEIKWYLGFGDFARFQDMPFPVVSEGMVDLYGLKAVENNYSR